MRENLELFLENPWLYVIGLILVGFYFYLKRKFENIADKEDLKALTREVEEVKKEIEFDNNKELNKYSERHRLIKNLWIKLCLYENCLDSWDFYTILENNEIQEFHTKIKMTRKDFDIAVAEFSLWFDDVVLVKAISEASDLLSKLEIDNFSFCLKAAGEYRQSQDLKSFAESIKLLRKDTSQLFKQYLLKKSAIRELLKELNG